jgi:hypothetical protein
VICLVRTYLLESSVLELLHRQLDLCRQLGLKADGSLLQASKRHHEDHYVSYVGGLETGRERSNDDGDLVTSTRCRWSADCSAGSVAVDRAASVGEHGTVQQGEHERVSGAKNCYARRAWLDGGVFWGSGPRCPARFFKR